MGAPAHVVAQIRAEARGVDPEQGFAVHPDNGPAVRLFLALGTQWSQAPLSTMTKAILVRTGLNYAAVPVTASMMSLDLNDDLFARLRLMEGEALAAWREASAQ